MLCYMDHRLQRFYLANLMREKIYKQTTQSVFDGYPMDNINVYFYVLLCASTYFYFLMQLITRRSHGATCSLGSLWFSGFRASRTGRWALGPSRYSWRSAIMSSCTKIRIGSEHWSSVLLNYVELCPSLNGSHQPRFSK